MLLASSAWAFGCSSSSTECTDRDGDRYGVGAGCVAADCDDSDPTRTTSCTDAGTVDCRERPASPGCPCLASSIAACHVGAENLAGVGICKSGTISCRSGRYSACVGAVGPRFESCNGIDDDCDGFIDDGVLSPCGGCTPGCTGAVWGEGMERFVPTDTTALFSNGELTLKREPRSFESLWVPSSGDGVVSKISTTRIVEDARYWVDHTSAGDAGIAASRAAQPTRVAVDYNGDAWIVNRAPLGQSTVTKIAGTRARCVDRNNDATIQTSAGAANILAPGSDECVLFTVPVGGTTHFARAIAIDGTIGLDGDRGGNAWIGLHNGEYFVELDARDGHEVRRVPTPGFAPTAAHFDPSGVLWSVSRDGKLARYARGSRDTAATLSLLPTSCFVLDGLTIDSDGRLWMTGFDCDLVHAIEPWLGSIRSATSSPSPRGISMSHGANPSAWITHTDERLSRFGVSPLGPTQVIDVAAPQPIAHESIGVATDAQGATWVVTTSGSGAGGELGRVTRIDQGTGGVTHRLEVGRDPHVQGDLTGTGLTAGYVSNGSISKTFTACPDGGTEWRAVHVRARGSAFARVIVRARHADNVAALANATDIDIGTVQWPSDQVSTSLSSTTTFAMSFPRGGVVSLSLSLETDHADGAPVISRVGVEWACPGPI